jgi:hypothetical protein
MPFDDCCTVFLPKHPVTRPKVEDIIMDGQLISCEKLVSDNKNARVIGLEKQNGEAAILVSNYVAKDDQSISVNYRVSKPSSVIDLDNDVIVETITSQKRKFCVKLSPRVRSKAFAVRPIE